MGLVEQLEEQFVAERWEAEGQAENGLGSRGKKGRTELELVGKDQSEHLQRLLELLLRLFGKERSDNWRTPRPKRNVLKATNGLPKVQIKLRTFIFSLAN